MARSSISQYDKGYRDGYMEGLGECGPISGFTKWFSRRAASKKLGAMKEAERHAVVAEAIAEYESEGKGAKERLLTNPGKSAHERAMEHLLKIAKQNLASAEKAQQRDLKFASAHNALTFASEAACEARSAGSIGKMHSAYKIAEDASEILAGLCNVKNPSKAASAALGGIGGGLLLGPLGAAAGAYGGVKLKQRAEGKKAKRTRARKKSAKRKKNPTVGRLVQDALK